MLSQAWQDGKETMVYCDGSGAAYGKERCGITWVVAYYRSSSSDECAVLYPAGAGGGVYRDKENPRSGRKRDFCDACAKFHGVQTTRLLGKIFDFSKYS